MFARAFSSLSARIILGVVATVLLIGAASFWILQSLYRRQLIDSLAASTTVQGELVEQSLRYAMHTRSLDLLAEMVRSLASQQDVEHVMILDKRGEIRFSSDPQDRGHILARSDPTCDICHQQDPSVRGRTVIFESEQGGRVFRNVNPILNSPSCMACHSPEDQINGVLIVDYSTAGMEAGLRATSRKMWIAAVILAMATVVVIVVLMRRMVVRRLRTMVQFIDSIQVGRLDRAIDDRGADELSLLSRHLNRMARSLDQSLERLREREAFLDAVVNSADDGIVVVDDELGIVTANHAFERLLGARSPGNVPRHCECQRLCSLDGPSECPARRTFQTGRVARCIRGVTREDGRMRYYEISASMLRNSGDRPQVLEIWRDITERREMEALLAQSERLASLGLLASGLSHEINNPLATITTCIDGLRRRMERERGPDPPPELQEYLALIRSEVDRCRMLTERLSVLGRTPRPERRAVDAARVVRETLALVRFEAERSAIRIEEHLPADLEPALADEVQVRQVILNLVLNGIQSIDGPGRLKVSARNGGDGWIEIEVTDSGRGIDPVAMRKIFEPFYSARPDGRGTGLGLFISKIIIDRIGGTLHVESRPGTGTRFTVTFPAGRRREVEA